MFKRISSKLNSIRSRETKLRLYKCPAAMPSLPNVTAEIQSSSRRVGMPSRYGQLGVTCLRTNRGTIGITAKELSNGRGMSVLWTAGKS
jgi:hypothetical protein